MQSTAPSTQQQPPAVRQSIRRAVKARDLTAESICKLAALNRYYSPDDEEWSRAYQAGMDGDWTSDTFSDRMLGIVDTAWAIEQEAAARALTEQQKEAARVASAVNRKQQRAAEVKPTNKYLKSKNLSVVHEAATPPKVDPLAAASPLSLQYAGRRTREKKRKPEPSPEPDAELEEDAAAHGIQLVPTHKEKRQKLGDDVATAKETAKEALKKLPPEVAQSLLQEVASTAPTRLVKRAPAAKAKSAAANKPRVADAAATQAYYEKKLADINKQRATDGHSNLNAASRKILFGLCKIHVNDKEHAFGASALQRPWDQQFYTEFDRHKDSTSDGEEEEEKKGDAAA
jgi:hypothetical protein